MPTIIALDVSLSMTRILPILNEDENITYHQLAVQGILQFLDYLTMKSKLEYVSLMVYSTLYEILVDFTRDYDTIKNALTKIEHYDKNSLENMLQAVSNTLMSNWGTQNHSQVLIFTDCGIGFGSTSLRNFNANLKQAKAKNDSKEFAWIPFSESSKLSIVGIGNPSESYFQHAVKLYQELLDVSGQKGVLFVPKEKESSIEYAQKEEKLDSTYFKQEMTDMINKLCEVNYKQFDAILKCGGYFKLECPVFIWPPPLPYTCKIKHTTRTISRKLEICGFLSLSDIGSPMSVSRHLIMAKPETSDRNKKPENMTEGEKLEADIKAFYSKNDSSVDEDGAGNGSVGNDAAKESVCVLLHGALKVENMAALVLLNDDWYGFIYSYADSKKKSNLMLTVLSPGHNVIPWLGDLRYVGTIDDQLPGENATFPVKPEKRSYSQNCVIWIKHAGLQSDIQKVLRHAKKLPEKTQNFYKELNRIRRAALSLGFVELLEGIATLFEREITLLPQNASPDCTMQLKHSAIELRKLTNRDLKTLITALPTRYNQL